MKWFEHIASSESPLDICATQVERYPLCVHARDRRGNTLCHYAVSKEDDRLLAVLLSSQLPRFWFPTNSDGVDILELSVQLKARCELLINVSDTIHCMQTVHQNHPRQAD